MLAKASWTMRKTACSISNRNWRWCWTRSSVSIEFCRDHSWQYSLSALARPFPSSCAGRSCWIRMVSSFRKARVRRSASWIWVSAASGFSLSSLCAVLIWAAAAKACCLALSCSSRARRFLSSITANSRRVSISSCSWADISLRRRANCPSSSPEGSSTRTVKSPWLQAMLASDSRFNLSTGPLAAIKP